MITTEQKKIIADKLPCMFIAEVDRLLRSGAISDDYKSNAVYKVAIENIANSFHANCSDYKNLRYF